MEDTNRKLWIMGQDPKESQRNGTRSTDGDYYLLSGSGLGRK
jgi:hypothetical protein